GVSRNSIRVSGRIAFSQAPASVPSTSVWVMPKRGRICSTTCRQEPNMALAATTWSPVFRAERNVADTAAMPVAVARPASGPSRRPLRATEMGGGGVPAPVLLIPAGLALETGFGFLSRLIGITGGEKQRLGGLLERRAHLAAPHRQGALLPVFRFFVGGH